MVCGMVGRWCEPVAVYGITHTVRAYMLRIRYLVYADKKGSWMAARTDMVRYGWYGLQGAVWYGMSYGTIMEGYGYDMGIIWYLVRYF